MVPRRTDATCIERTVADFLAGLDVCRLKIGSGMFEVPLRDKQETGRPTRVHDAPHGERPVPSMAKTPRYIDYVILNLGAPAFRLALYDTAGRKCVWCKEPIVCYSDLQIDHLIYKTIDPDALQSQIEGFELDPAYNVHETYNLVPVHGPCNRSKSDKPLVISALNASILSDAQQRAEEVEKKAEANKKLLSAETSKALATLESHRNDPQVMEKVRQFLLDISSSEVGNVEPVLEFSVLPDLAIAVNALGSVKAFSLGDCPNSNCITGDVNWQTFPQSTTLLRAGYCDACGTFAVECPDCDTRTSFVWDAEQTCDGCENRFVTERVGGELWDVAVQ